MKRTLLCLGFAVAVCSARRADAQPLTAWEQPVNVSTAAGTLTKSGGCGDCPDAGAHSATHLDGNGFVEFTPAIGHRITAGLSSDLSASTAVASIDFAFSLWPSGTFEIRERGVYRSEGTFASGDRLRITLEGHTVTYSRNGAVIYTNAAASPLLPMALDATLTTSGASIAGATVSAAPTRTPVAWESPVRVLAEIGRLTKSAGCDGCPDAGAHSVARISGEGYAEFMAGSGTITAGLSADFSASTSLMSMRYAFTLRPSGSWEVRELGIYRTEGTFVPGDRFRVAVETGKVIYRRNGVKVYTSLVPPVLPLVLDTTLSSSGASLLDVATGTGSPDTGSIPTTTTTVPPTPAPAPAPAPLPVVLPSGVVTSGPYTAVIDRQTYAKPAVPVFGPAGTQVTDPVFQSQIGRMTDGLTRPDAPNRSYRTPSSPHQNAWSALGTYFYVTSGDGSILPFRFDPTTVTAQRLNPSASGDGGLVLRFYVEPQFSYVDDALIYGSTGGISGATLRTIDQYDFSAARYSRLLDLDALVPGLAGTYVGGVGSTAGPVERVMAFFGGTSQDLHHYVVIFDKANPQNRLLLDTLGNTLNGQPTSFPLSMSLHHAAIDRSGRYVMLYSTWTDQQSTRKAAQSYLWDTQTGGFTELNTAALPYGHDAFGYGVTVNQDCCVSTSWDAAQWQFRTLSSPLVTREILKAVLTPKEIYWADHTTWNNARPDQQVPFISGTYRAPTSTTAWRAWDDEIIAVQTDAAAGTEATVWRFAHHRSDVRNDTNAAAVSFWYEPRPNVSPDGRWALFTSNWEKTLGTDPTADATTSARQDVFVVALKR